MNTPLPVRACTTAVSAVYERSAGARPSRPLFAGRDAPRSRFRILLAACSCAVAGCEQEIDTRYGQRDGPEATLSVNGTAVLAEMFEQAGHKVTSWNMLSPQLAQRAECIVWFPDDFRPPSREVVAWLERWLCERPDRTLIYVGRDFDAECGLLGEDRARRPGRPGGRSETPARCGPQQLSDRPALERRPRRFRRGSGWTASTGRARCGRSRATGSGSKASTPRRLEIELFGRMKPNAWADVLLQSEGDAIVAREWFDVRGGDGESQLIVVANGSFLLNLPLVNREHRKLAGKLIAEIGTPAATWCSWRAARTGRRSTTKSRRTSIAAAWTCC